MINLQIMRRRPPKVSWARAGKGWAPPTSGYFKSASKANENTWGGVEWLSLNRSWKGRCVGVYWL